MKVLILGDCNSSHIIKWALSLSEQGVNVSVWSFTREKHAVFEANGIQVFSANIKLNNKNLLSKVKYISSISSLKRCMQMVRPDILHAHYATSYGLLGSLVNFHPYLISVWGSDVYEFPRKNKFFKWIFVRNLSKADRILSTSHAMAQEIKKYIKRAVDITPFGIDLDKFRYDQKLNGPFTIGTVKSLEVVYGIDILLEAFDIFRKKNPSEDLKLLIVGDGSLKEKLIFQAAQLGLNEYCDFVGKVPYQQVPDIQQKLDVVAILSRQESFGVSAIEGSACGKPVIVSNVGGLPEVIEDGVTGIVVPALDAERSAEAMQELFSNPDLRKKMGFQGRKKVENNYSLTSTVKTMIDIYKSVI